MILLRIYAVLAVVFSISILLKKPLTGSQYDYEQLTALSNSADYPMLYRMGVAVFGGLFWWVTLYLRFQDLLDTEKHYWDNR